MAKINFNLKEWTLLKNKWKKSIDGLDCDIEYPEYRSRINIDKLDKIKDKISPDKLAVIKTLTGREFPYRGYEEFRHIIIALNLDYEEIINLEIFDDYDYEPVSFEEGSEILYSAVKKEEKEHSDILKVLVRRNQITPEMSKVMNLVYEHLLDYHLDLDLCSWGEDDYDPCPDIGEDSYYARESTRALIDELKELQELMTKEDEVKLIVKQKKTRIAGCMDIMKRCRNGDEEEILTRLYEIYHETYIKRTMPEGCNEPDKATFTAYYIYQDEKDPKFTEKPCRAINRVADILV